MIFAKCCCCIPLRSGCLSIAILDLSGGFITFGMLGMTYGWNYIGYEDVFAGIFLAISGLFLLCGSIKYDQLSTAFHLLISISVNGMYAYLAVHNYVEYGWTTPFFSFFVVYLFIVLIQIYFFLCVLSFFKSLRQQENASHV